MIPVVSGPDVHFCVGSVVHYVITMLQSVRVMVCLLAARVVWFQLTVVYKQLHETAFICH